MPFVCICKSEQSLYFSTQQRLEVVFTGRSKILCGVSEECLASGLQRWPHSVWMMSHRQETKTYIQAGVRPIASTTLLLLKNQCWKKSVQLWNIIPLLRFQSQGQKLSMRPPESESFSLIAYAHKDSPTSCNRSHDPLQPDVIWSKYVLMENLFFRFPLYLSDPKAVLK